MPRSISPRRASSRLPPPEFKNPCGETVAELWPKPSNRSQRQRPRFYSFVGLSRRELVGVAGCIRLITQRSVVQIHPPQPTFSIGYGQYFKERQLPLAPN